MDKEAYHVTYHILTPSKEMSNKHKEDSAILDFISSNISKIFVLFLFYDK